MKNPPSRSGSSQPTPSIEPNRFTPSPSSRNQTPWQPRFGIREMLMLMLICSVLAAALGYLYQDEKGGGRSMRFIVLTVAGPSMMAAVLGISFIVYELTTRRKRKKKPSKPDEVF